MGPGRRVRVYRWAVVFGRGWVWSVVGSLGGRLGLARRWRGRPLLLLPEDQTSRGPPQASSRTTVEVWLGCNGTGSCHAYGLFVWLVAGADLFWKKSTAGWLLVADLLWEKSIAGRWLISQANRVLARCPGLFTHCVGPRKWITLDPEFVRFGGKKFYGVTSDVW
jgi:hypothetical protein